MDFGQNYAIAIRLSHGVKTGVKVVSYLTTTYYRNIVRQKRVDAITEVVAVEFYVAIKVRYLP